MNNIVIDFDTPHRLGGIYGEVDNRKWLYSSENGVYSACGKDAVIKKTLKPGLFTVFQDSSGACHTKEHNIETEELYFLPNTMAKEIVSEISEFWSKKDLFKSYNMTHKRGLLLFGPPGTGKTSITYLIANMLVEKNEGYVFFIRDREELYIYLNFIHMQLRKIHPDTPVITIIEDIDKYIDGSNTETCLLRFLDGDESFDHHVVIGTTNRPDHLNDLVLRPSRFDWHILIDKPSKETREAYLTWKKLPEDEIVKWSEASDGLSLAELKELFVAVMLLDNDFQQAIDKLKDQSKAIVNTTFKSKPKNTLGFGFGVKN